MTPRSGRAPKMTASYTGAVIFVSPCYAWFLLGFRTFFKLSFGGGPPVMARADDGKLGGLVRRKLVRELALKEPGTTNAAIGKRYGVTGQAIGQFAKRHAEEIAAVAAAADDEFAGILIAQKAYRLAALQEMHEIAMTPQPKVTPQGNVVHRWNPETGQDEEVMEVDVRAAALVSKQAAEELGQLANRVTLSGQIDTTTTYKIVGVDPSDLT